jgi:hypothetical protein
VTTRLGGLVLAAALTAAGTWLVGWWAVIAVAVVWQLLWREGPAWRAALAAALAWALLLALIPQAPLGRLTERLAGLFRLPPWALVPLVLGYASLLGWSSARVVLALADAGIRRSSSRR